MYAAYVWTSKFYDESDPLHLACRDSTDQYTGIYRIDVESGKVEPVLTKHDGWPGCFPDDIAEGANDLAIDAAGQNLYVVTDGDPALIRIPIGADGSSGVPAVVARDLSPLDGIALDESGNIYVSEILRSEISVFSADGTQRIVIATPDTAPLVNPTSLVYRDGTICAANLGWNVTPEPRSIACVSGYRRPVPAKR